MTSYEMKECVYCLEYYDWQASGYGCYDDLNDSRYCPECQQIILDALEEKGNVKYDYIYVETDDFTAEELKQKQRERLASAEEQGAIGVIRSFVPVYDMKDPSNHCDGFVERVNGKDYSVDIWSKTPERNSVKVRMRENLETGERTFPNLYIRS